MIFHWSGKGFLVPVITFGCLLAGEFLSETAFHDDQYFQQHAWPILLAFLAAAGLVHLLAQSLAQRTARTLVDPATGETVVVHREDTFFGVPLRYWGPILVVVGFLFFSIILLGIAPEDAPRRRRPG